MAQENTNAINFGEQFDTSDFDLVDSGKYEVVIDKIDKKKSKTGKNYLNFTFTIRKDVEQKFKNRKLFYMISEKDNDICYDFNRINKLIITQKGRSNYKDHFVDADEVLQYLHGLHMVLEVETNFDDFTGKDRNEIKDRSFEPSVWDQTEHVAEIKGTNLESIDTPNDDLPF